MAITTDGMMTGLLPMDLLPRADRPEAEPFLPWGYGSMEEEVPVYLRFCSTSRSIVAAMAMSLLVTPPAECVLKENVTVRQRMSMSGW
jgi:hypothetical protein